MSWITNLRPRLRFFAKKETPDNLWTKCRGCSQMVFQRELKENLFVCPHCDFHERIGPAERFNQIFDGDSESGGTYARLPVPMVADDPLKFRDQKPYPARLKAARQKTGEMEAFLLARGLVAGVDSVVGVQNFDYMGGSMGMGVGAAFVAGAQEAKRQGLPYIVFTASGGARMQEGLFSLMQMPRATVAIEELNEAGLPYVVVLTDPTTGGVTASYAMLGDVQIAEPGALIGLAGQRVIEQTIREKLPEGFQRAEFLLEHGMLDKVVHRKDLKDVLGRIISMMMDARAGRNAAA
ncbi:acetyl-CoA carboxylase, carboxyltransferase subunit beta [Pacificimonas flava]|uniref:Acetyl-coenzyme A carboxylase carboxyl transferase subunit beta n=2 Tax=Pacificimonas TaxID=1960290 RepID=A0A219B2R9_9SPHN|nr:MULTISPECIES: acetyl-CoA carboxylase, carboxyltransferase subunit beta [Pacificimonas]MBZ6378276.1 acetyl-CoA carboxylase carboxyltransferase subunit beta [Pacificimonas aurantium]OWV32108.1 acetyl-CoA carboxylase, carboxyltransferase subunit beta [Pacificimonas flava]